MSVSPVAAAELEEYDEEEEEEDQQPMYDDAGGMRAVAGGDSEELYHDATSNKQMAANRGLCARALYDYQAGRFLLFWSSYIVGRGILASEG